MQDDDPAPGKHPDPLQYLAGALELLRLSERVTTVQNVVQIHMPEGADLDAMRLALRLARAKQLDGPAEERRPRTPALLCPYVRPSPQSNGWTAYFAGVERHENPGLKLAGGERKGWLAGWDAAKAAHEKRLGEISA